MTRPTSLVETCRLWLCLQAWHALNILPTCLQILKYIISLMSTLLDSSKSTWTSCHTPWPFTFEDICPQSHCGIGVHLALIWTSYFLNWDCSLSYLRFRFPRSQSYLFPFLTLFCIVSLCCSVFWSLLLTCRYRASPDNLALHLPFPPHGASLLFLYWTKSSLRTRTCSNWIISLFIPPI